LAVFLFHKLLDLEIDNYFPILEHIEDSIEKIDEDVTDKRSHDLLDRILEVRKHIIMIKRYATPQREKLKKLLQLNHKLIDKKAYPYFRDLQDNAIKISESIENYNEAVSHTFSIYMSAVSKSMNEVMKVLSVIATIALPLTVISSIYGTNFLKLPGAGHEYGFWIMIAGMVAVVAIMMYAFRRRGWF